MPRTCTVSLSPEAFLQAGSLHKAAAHVLNVSPKRITGIRQLRRSIDARKTPVRYQLSLEVWIDEPFLPEPLAPYEGRQVHKAPEVHIAGTGPAGLFAALRLIELGIKPVIFERGRAVRERRRDLARLNREGIVNPDSNYCFGEGGAGTFSDGKLYTRSTKRGDVRRVLELLTHFGADPDILVDAHPHIGTNKLPQVIQAMREQIIACGGEVHFDSRITDIRAQSGELHSIRLGDDSTARTRALILATGHSARDIFAMLHHNGIFIEAKPFALGLRVEHPQALIDGIQYHCGSGRPEGLPAAAYALVQQVQGKGVYSFCMCPGGIICPAATQPDGVVVNGWSPSMRNTGFANSGIVVETALSDFYRDGEPLSGIAFQQSVEAAAYAAGGGRQVAPAQRLTDFVAGRLSADLPACSYLPGIHSADLRAVLPGFVHSRLAEAFRYFGKSMKGYLSREAVVVGVESRTSSPVRIPRDAESLMHPGASGLFPCGEGAGYAGGIVSAALDGLRCAEAAARWINT